MIDASVSLLLVKRPSLIPSATVRASVILIVAETDSLNYSRGAAP